MDNTGSAVAQNQPLDLLTFNLKTRMTGKKDLQLTLRLCPRSSMTAKTSPVLTVWTHTHTFTTKE